MVYLADAGVNGVNVWFEAVPNVSQVILSSLRRCSKNLAGKVGFDQPGDDLGFLGHCLIHRCSRWKLLFDFVGYVLRHYNGFSIVFFQEAAMQCTKKSFWIFS